MKKKIKNKKPLSRSSHTGRMNRLENRDQTAFIAFQKEVVQRFLTTLHAIKLFHWKTTRYSTHKATDKLHEELSSNVDRFVEVMLGKLGNRVDLTSIKTMPLYDVNNDEQFNQMMKDFKCFLFSLDNHPGMITMKNNDLITIRDEILANVNQFLYLQTLK